MYRERNKVILLGGEKKKTRLIYGHLLCLIYVFLYWNEMVLLIEHKFDAPSRKAKLDAAFTQLCSRSSTMRDKTEKRQNQKRWPNCAKWWFFIFTRGLTKQSMYWWHSPSIFIYRKWDGVILRYYCISINILCDCVRL